MNKNKGNLPYIEDYLLELSNNNYSLDTIKSYQRDLAIFSKFLVIQRILFKELTKKTIILYKGFLKNRKYLDSLKKESENARTNSSILKTRSKGARNDRVDQRRLSSRSINRMLSTLRSYLRFLVDFDHPVPLAPDAVKFIKTEQKESQVADFEDIVRLIEFPDSFEKNKIVASRNRAILELLFSTGMRISELTNLNLDDLDLSSNRKSIRQGKIFIMGKGKKQRLVYLTERCKNNLENYLQYRKDKLPSLFVPTRGRRIRESNLNNIRISIRYIQNRIVLYRRTLGIVIPVSPHSLRHGFATYLAEKGANPAAIQHLLGHESLQTTTKYVHASDRFAEKTHKKFHPLQNS